MTGDVDEGLLQSMLGDRQHVALSLKKEEGVGVDSCNVQYVTRPEYLSVNIKMLRIAISLETGIPCPHLTQKKI